MDKPWVKPRGRVTCAWVAVMSRKRRIYEKKKGGSVDNMRHREEKLKVQRSVPTHIDAYPYKERHFSKLLLSSVASAPNGGMYIYTSFP